MNGIPSFNGTHGGPQSREQREYAAWHAQAVANEVARIVAAARARNDFLRDAPEGSSDLRKAILEEAIRATLVQYNGCNRSRPFVATTGLSVAMEAARVVMEAK